MTILRRVNLAVAFAAMLAPMAHVLELPNKLALEAPLWLGIQQHLYRGWGPFLGGPTEIGALATSVALLWRRRGRRAGFGLTLVAVLAYAGMLASYFVLNRPVNMALNGWTAATLPADWAAYRLRWEAGHALAAALSLVAAAALTRAWLIERDRVSLTRDLARAVTRDCAEGAARVERAA